MLDRRRSVQADPIPIEGLSGSPHELIAEGAYGLWNGVLMIAEHYPDAETSATLEKFDQALELPTGLADPRRMAAIVVGASIHNDLDPRELHFANDAYSQEVWHNVVSITENLRIMAPPEP